MSKRYYYTCPIKALYMMKEFGVKFSEAHGANHADRYYQIDEAQLCDFITQAIEDFRGIEQIYVAKESEHIFEPKKRDEGRWARPVGAHYANHNGEQWVSAGIEPNPPEIIMRDNKQFFMPEVEK
jgi:hypothetical protein